MSDEQQATSPRGGSNPNTKTRTRGPRRRPLSCGPDFWDIPSWCGEVGVGTSTYHVLPIKPHSVKLGKLRKITESPGDYKRRVAAIQKESKQAEAVN